MRGELLCVLTGPRGQQALLLGTAQPLSCLLNPAQGPGVGS